MQPSENPSPIRPQLSPSEAAVHALEWPRFLSLAEKEARTEPGKLLIQALHSPEADMNSLWAKSVEAARHLQQETQEITQLLDREALWGPLTDLSDPSEILEVLGRGGVLEVTHLALLRNWI